MERLMTEEEFKGEVLGKADFTWEDEGIGSYEYWGAQCVQTCWAAVATDGEVEVPITGLRLTDADDLPQEFTAEVQDGLRFGELFFRLVGFRGEPSNRMAVYSTE